MESYKKMIQKKPRKNLKIEQKQQIQLIERFQAHPFLKNYFEFLASYKDGFKTSIGQAVMLKKMGGKAGVSDLMFFYPSKGYHGMFLEFKPSRNYKSQVSQKQRDFVKMVKNVGYYAVVAYGPDEALDEFLGYLK
jgi:hypothetical protein